jgi:hypothetical protein
VTPNLDSAAARQRLDARMLYGTTLSAELPVRGIVRSYKDEATDGGVGRQLTT